MFGNIDDGIIQKTDNKYCQVPNKRTGGNKGTEGGFKLELIKVQAIINVQGGSLS